jgi:uncharacterized protein DUF2817
LTLEPGSFFSPDYAAARGRFLAAARATGAILESLPLAATGPGGEELSIDVARLGSPDATRVLLHTSGLHGVEGFAGSAVQLAALERAPAVPAGGAIVLVHVLNPYGMAWLRRTNENNVDLNRNFLAPGERWAGAPALYSRLDPLLNPSTPPGPDRFRWRLAAIALRHGPRALKQAIAEGQYEFPRGLFFGGRALEPGPRLYLDFLRRSLERAEYLLAIDLHTGLGPRAGETLILEAGVGTTPAGKLERGLGGRLVDPAAGRAPYRIRGGMGGALPAALPRARSDFLLQEIGTCPARTVLAALREENRCHHHGGQPTHPAKQALLEAFRPSSPKWRRQAVEKGTRLLHAAAAWTFEKQ